MATRVAADDDDDDDAYRRHTHTLSGAGGAVKKEKKGNEPQSKYAEWLEKIMYTPRSEVALRKSFLGHPVRSSSCRLFCAQLRTTSILYVSFFTSTTTAVTLLGRASVGKEPRFSSDLLPEVLQTAVIMLLLSADLKSST